MVRQLVKDQLTFIRMRWAKNMAKDIQKGTVDPEGWRDEPVEVSVRDLEDKVPTKSKIQKKKSKAILQIYNLKKSQKKNTSTLGFIGLQDEITPTKKLVQKKSFLPKKKIKEPK